jgi:hypothetical protein
MALKFDSAEFREREAREQRDRALAVIAEFGGWKKERMLVPEDDPANDKVKLQLAAEILFLRGQIRRIGKAMELVQAGKPFTLIPPGPYWRPGEHRLNLQLPSQPARRYPAVKSPVAGRRATASK